jgi:SnoaL-like domain
MGDDVATRSDETGTGSASPEAAAFVERFAAAWRAGREGLRDFESLVDPDVVLTQPMMPTGHGLEAFRAQFDAIFAAAPDLRGEVLAWGATADGVLIDLALRGTIGGRPVELVTCDRIVLREGRMLERHARMDPLPLVRATLGRPGLALRLLRPGGGGGARGAARATTGGGAGASADGGGEGVGDPGRGGEAGAGALTALAVGRLVLGALSRVSPRAAAGAFGAGGATSPELDYMTRIFGARALALGTGYLVSRGEARRTWQRIALGVDVSDTIAGIGHLRRGDVPTRSAVMLTALTGAYAAVGAAQLARDVTR